MDAEQVRRREQFFDMCARGISSMNAAADQVLRFNFRCLALGSAADAEELEVLADLLAETRQCCDLVHQRTRLLFGKKGPVPPFDMMLARLVEISRFVELLIQRTAPSIPFDL